MNEIKNELTEYAERFTSDESEVLREFHEHCYEHYEDKAMLSGFVQGRILSMFSRMIRPSVVLEDRHLPWLLGTVFRRRHGR